MLNRYIIAPLIFGLVVVFILDVLIAASMAESLGVDVLLQAVQSMFSEVGSLIMVGVLFLMYNLCTIVVRFMQVSSKR